MLDEAVSVEAIRHFCQLATKRLGIRFEANHHALVAGRVAKRLRALQLGLDEYLEQLNDDCECDEVVGFLDFLRPRPPRFFARREDHIALHAHLVRVLEAGKRRIRLWSAGCGTGEEAYSMALTALIALQTPELGAPDFDIKVLATDISKPALQRGSRGVFDEDQLRDVPRSLCERYFRETEDGMAIDDHVKGMVCFRRLNLTKLPFPMAGPLDAIFCHEGLAPLVSSARKRAADAVKALLSEQGLLCTGFSDEALAASDDEDEPFPTATLAHPLPHGHC